MKKIIFVLLASLIFLIVAKGTSAYVYTHGYWRSNGTYVQPYWRTNPNSYRRDNFSYYGNYNPFNGRYGTRHYYWDY